MNWKAITMNLSEAREELARLEGLAAAPTRRSAGGLEVGLAHAYRHLNVAWHVRRVPMSRYATLTDADFNRWGRFPKDLELARLESERVTKRGRGSTPNARSQRTGATPARHGR
jgi:hypothetical protein